MISKFVRSLTKGQQTQRAAAQHAIAHALLTPRFADSVGTTLRHLAIGTFPP